MNEREKQKLNEKLAKWARLKDVQVFLDHSGKVTKIQCEKPNYSQLYEIIEPFTDSLDACFKWLVPKLVWWDMWSFEDTNIKGKRKEKFISASAQLKNGQKPQNIIDKNPTLALCLATEKLIDIEEG